MVNNLHEGPVLDMDTLIPQVFIRPSNTLTHSCLRIVIVRQAVVGECWEGWGTEGVGNQIRQEASSGTHPHHPNHHGVSWTWGSTLSLVEAEVRAGDWVAWQLCHVGELGRTRYSGVEEEG